MNRSNRFARIILIALSLSLLLGACGGDDDVGNSEASPEGNLEAFCAAAESIGTAGPEPESDTMRGFIDDLAENAPPEIREAAAVLAQWFNEIIDKYEDDPDAQLSPDDITEEVQDAQVKFQGYIEENCPQYQPTPAES